MDFDQHIPHTEKAGAMRLIELPLSKHFLSILYPQIPFKLKVWLHILMALY